MTTQEATKLLSQNGIKVLKLSKNLYSVSYVNGQPWENTHFCRKGWAVGSLKNEWSGREIIHLARAYTDSNQQTSLHKNVKKFSNDKDRSATRDAIQTENFDVIPSKKRTKTDDIWGWS